MSNVDENPINEIQYLSIKEFREEGYLQEANRLFFHPHGLALEITQVDPKRGWNRVQPGSVAAEYFERIKLVVCKRLGLTDEAAAPLVIDILNMLFPPGTEFISGVWDYRDDPEGVLFDWPAWEANSFKIEGHPADKAERVLDQWCALWDGRAQAVQQIYGEVNSNIEPTEWVNKNRG